MSPIAIIFWCLLALAIGLAYAQYTLASPVVAIVNHWVRWVLFSCAFVFTGEYFESDRPEWLWFATGFLIWPLIETMHSWLNIRALSHSTLPLFPRFKINRDGDAWPNQPRFIALREWLREEKFTPVQSLKADLADGLALRVSVYNDVEARTRLQMMFIPQPTGNVTLCAIYTSVTESGTRLVTDNIFLPFGGFYPERWEVERHPWIRSPEALMCRHLRRLAANPALLAPFEDDPLNDLNHQQQILERTNTEYGILFPRSEHEEHGILTWEGRYRVWKEAWLLSYFGRSRRY